VAKIASSQIVLPVNSTLEIVGTNTPEELGYHGTWELVDAGIGFSETLNPASGVTLELCYIGNRTIAVNLGGNSTATGRLVNGFTTYDQFWRDLGSSLAGGFTYAWTGDYRVSLLLNYGGTKIYLDVLGVTYKVILSVCNTFTINCLQNCLTSKEGCLSVYKRVS